MGSSRARKGNQIEEEEDEDEDEDKNKKGKRIGLFFDIPRVQLFFCFG